MVENVARTPLAAGSMMMNLEDYFAFNSPSDIRLAGSRIGIQTVLYEYIHRSQTPEQIAQHYAPLRLDQVYATILYYLVHRERLDAYLVAWLAAEERAVAAQEADPGFRAFRDRMGAASEPSAGQPAAGTAADD